MISGIGVFYPDKRPTQRIAIVPDIEARPTIDGIRSRRDEVLEVALRQILGLTPRRQSSSGWRSAERCLRIKFHRRSSNPDAGRSRCVAAAKSELVLGDRR
jgi:hypothetical protein